ncbi:tRNA lysidine(34) synthetase TilS [Lutimonas halocynthiae]|uniref:tRNA lysidine(34) synthetase TilS n=1 Tax=Lutimonas halocynthiae TaxID=1446477 RepID=UPI0025B294FD|nr:tRNA lysidine(34) synthetase TilS [Lutimonas halocynthiae]MDN3641480.1 tRNA lysidine(34) synthetase TilS [Lutimonas halocynthiae]
MFNRFKIHLQESFPELRSKKLLLAVSGGIDSMVLYDLLIKLDYDLSLAHCNFNLRGDASDKDEAFIKSEAKKTQSHLHLINFDTIAYAQKEKTSIQMAARALRYNWFDDVLKEGGYDFLLTAHHADDNVETFMINLSRGTGLEGLTGIPEKTRNIRRPLLPFSKDDIHIYAKDQQIKWREDLSNEDNKYLRNKIRNELVPILKEINPSFLHSFNTTINNLQGTKEIVNDSIKQIHKSVVEKNEDNSIITFNINALLKFSDKPSYLYEIFNPYGFQQIEDIITLLSGQSGKQVLSKTHRLVKHREQLLLSQVQTKNMAATIHQVDETDKLFQLNDISIHFEDLTSTNFEGLNYSTDTAHFDKNLLTYPLYVRKWEKGDYFYPIGMKGKKKLSKFFKDEKYSLLQKENIWLLCSGSDVIWVIGKRMDDRYKITDKTIHIIKATVQT